MAKGRKGKKGNMSREQQQAMYASMRSRGVSMGKTPQGMDADLRKSANVLPDTPANRRKWEKPGGSRRMDLEGIDTKPKIVMQVTFEDVTPDIPKDWTDITQEEHDRFIIKIEDELSSTLLSGRKQKFTDKELSEWAKERGYTGAMVDTAYRNKTRSVDDIEREIKKVESQLEGLHFGATSRAQATTRSARSGNLAKRLDSLKDELRDRKEGESDIEFSVNSTLLNEDLLQRAHAFTSFDPEKRAEMEREKFKINVQDVYDELKEHATTPEQKKQLKEEMVKFQTRYAEKYNDELATRGRMLSPMITGPANFPVNRNKKAINSYENKVRANAEFRDKVVKGIKRRWRKENIESAGGERAILERNLKDARDEHNRMIEANKITRKKIPDDEKITLLKGLGFTDKDIADSTPKTVAKKGDKFDKKKINAGGFEWVKGTISDIKFNVAGSNADIKRMEGRLWVIDKRKATPTGSNKFSGGEIVDNNEADRVQILFDDKPDDAMRGKLKGEGWRWSPRNSAWQRKRTDAAMRSAKRIVGA